MGDGGQAAARGELEVRLVIPPEAGRPSVNLPGGGWRRRFARKADRRHYRWRSQAETINSMLKRNMGDELRSRLKPRRKHETLLRSVVHDIMLAAALDGVWRQSLDAPRFGAPWTGLSGGIRR